MADIHEGEEKQLMSATPPTVHPVLITGITFSTFFLATVMKSRWKAISKNASLTSYRKMLLKTMVYMTCWKTAFPKELVITAELQCRKQFRILQIGSVTCWQWSWWGTVSQRELPFHLYWWTTGMLIQTYLFSVQSQNPVTACPCKKSIQKVFTYNVFEYKKNWIYLVPEMLQIIY